MAWRRIYVLKTQYTFFFLMVVEWDWNENDNIVIEFGSSCSLSASRYMLHSAVCGLQSFDLILLNLCNVVV